MFIFLIIFINYLILVMGTGGKCDSEHIQAVLTCQGDIDDPDFPTRCQSIFDKLSKVLDNG